MSHMEDDQRSKVMFDKSKKKYIKQFAAIKFQNKNFIFLLSISITRTTTSTKRLTKNYLTK